MLCLADRSILRELLLAVSAFLVLSSLVSAQHPVVPVPHPPAPTVHVPAPPIYHSPIFQAPVMRPPVMYAPVYGPTRIPTVSSVGALGLPYAHPPMRPIRPKPPVVFVYSLPFLARGPFLEFDMCLWTTCDLFWPWAPGYTSVSSPGPINYVPQVYETPVYVYGYEREDTPQLFLKNGGILNVTDYWLVDDQLHFTVIEQAGTKPVEQSIPFDALDLQKTVDSNTARGFRFVLRNEPVDQYVRDHPDGVPPVAAPPQE